MKISSFGDRVFDAINYFLLTIALLVVLFPLLFVVAASLSDPTEVITGNVWFWPVGINLKAYTDVLVHPEIMSGYRNTIIYTIVGTAFNLVLTICAAYPMSRRDFVGRNFFMMAMVFTMYFSGGLIPSFIINRELGLINSFWVMILPGAISTTNVIIMRTFFVNSVPQELHEASVIDGCTNIGTLLRIILPLSKPVISVLLLSYAVSHWNAFFNALIYLTDKNKYPLQLVLREILIQRKPLDVAGMTADDLRSYSDQLKRAETLKYSVIVVANLPVLMIYPLIQKYFMQGVMIGAIKG